MEGNVVQIKPKTANRRYKNHSYTVTYIPATKEWKWEVTYVTTTYFSDKAKTMIAAFKAAEKHIDRTLEMRRG